MRQSRSEWMDAPRSLHASIINRPSSIIWRVVGFCFVTLHGEIMLRMKKKLIVAINQSAVIKMTYKDLIYIVEPYMIWANHRNKHYLHGYKLSGGYIKNPGDHWANFILRYITKVDIIGNYKAPLAGYNPKSDMFDVVIHQWRISRKNV